MRLFVATAAPHRQKTDCAIVGLHEGGGLTGAAAALDSALAGRLGRLIKRGDVRGKTGELRLVDTDGAACERVLIVGLGKKSGVWPQAVPQGAACRARRDRQDRRPRCRELPRGIDRRSPTPTTTPASPPKRSARRSTACRPSAARASRPKRH